MFNFEQEDFHISDGTQHRAKTPQQGFTLIELSIVLVIIGLIVGGVLVGRDLIHAASVRAQVAQIEKYNAAVNTFRAKYNAVPGDMIPAIATTFGMFALSNPNGLQGMGDNSGTIEDGGAGSGTFGGGTNWNSFGGEIPVFWRHLSDANMVDGQFGTTGNSVPNINTGAPTGTVNNITQSIPQAKLRSMFVSVFSGRGTNYYTVFHVDIVGSFAGYYINTLVGMSPIEAQNIDAKMDDGMPETGGVLAVWTAKPIQPQVGSPAQLIGNFPPSAATTSTLNKCVITTDPGGFGILATDTYNLVPSTGGNDPSCALAIRFQ